MMKNNEDPEFESHWNYTHIAVVENCVFIGVNKKFKLLGSLTVWLNSLFFFMFYGTGEKTKFTYS